MTAVFLFEGAGYYAKDRKIPLYRRPWRRFSPLWRSRAICWRSGPACWKSGTYNPYPTVVIVTIGPIRWLTCASKARRSGPSSSRIDSSSIRTKAASPACSSGPTGRRMVALAMVILAVLTSWAIVIRSCH